MRWPSGSRRRIVNPFVVNPQRGFKSRSHHRRSLTFLGGLLVEQRIPQGDLLTFSPTLLFVPLTFLGGYYFFSTVWVPRLLLTLKARNWLTTWGAFFLVSSEVWPEIFLMFVQFGGLIWVVWSLGLPATPGDEGLLLVSSVPTHVAGFTPGGEPLVVKWIENRGGFFTPRGVHLTRVVELVLGGGAGPTRIGKTWPTARSGLLSALSLPLLRRG